MQVEKTICVSSGSWLFLCVTSYYSSARPLLHEAEQAMLWWPLRRVFLLLLPVTHCLISDYLT